MNRFLRTTDKQANSMAIANSVKLPSVAADSPLTIRSWDEVDPASWDRFVKAHPRGSVFHTTPLLRAYQRTPKHEPHGWAAVDADDCVVAMLTAVRIETVTGVASRLASRCVWYAEPIAIPGSLGLAATSELIRQHDLRLGGRTVFTEVRPLEAPGSERDALEAAGYTWSGYYNYVVDTTIPADTLWKRLGKSTRKKLRQSERRGVEILEDGTHAMIERMYPLVATSYRRSQVPLADPDLFHAALDELGPEVVKVRLANYQGRDVAGGIGLYDGRRFFAWYGGSVRDSAIVPFDALTWDEIAWTANQGGTCYDFGGAGWANEDYGPRQFKAKFGGELTNFGRYRKIHRRWKFLLANQAYNQVRKWLAPK